MFTGIVQCSLPIAQLTRKEGLLEFSFEFPDTMMHGLITGASVALDGVCLTVSRLSGQTVGFDLMQETLDRSTFDTVTTGSLVHVERSLSFGSEIGGHLVSGHVDGTATLVKVDAPENNRILTLEVAPSLIKYVLPKGYIALNGASLTVVAVDSESARFTVHLIPETLRITTFGAKRAGDRINVEVDRQTQAIVDTVERYLKLSKSGERLEGASSLHGILPSPQQSLSLVPGQAREKARRMSDEIPE